MMYPEDTTEHCPTCEQPLGPTSPRQACNLQVAFTSGKMLSSSYASDVSVDDAGDYVEIRQMTSGTIMIVPLANILWLSWTPPATEEVCPLCHSS
jgi:hypothetical protein